MKDLRSEDGFTIEVLYADHIFEEDFDRCLQWMADPDGHAPSLGQPEKLEETPADGLLVGIVVQEDLAFGCGNTELAGKLVGNGFSRGNTIDEIEVFLFQSLEDRHHKLTFGRYFRAHMIIHSLDEWNLLEVVLE